MILRPYTVLDKHACEAIARSNAPRFFLESELPEFSAFLSEPGCPYFVVEDSASELIACGGYYLLPEQNSARLCWGMVQRDKHRAGVGSFLLCARMKEIARAGIARVCLDTSQHSAGFFAKHGFQTLNIAPDGYGPGLDRLEMELKLKKSVALI